MPPALAKDLAYSSLRNERHTPAPPLPPNGPSPSMPVNISLNIECRNTASKSVAWVRALALAWSAGIVPISHPLDVGLDGAVRLHRLQDGDHVERADAERVEPVDQLLQGYA